MSATKTEQGLAKIEPPWSKANGVSATYDLHCHCGAIKYRMTLSPPLYDEQAEGKDQYVALECKCSLCERHGYIAAHPLAKNVEWLQGLEDRASYYSAAQKCPHWFCRKCGCMLATDLTWLMENVFHDENRTTINLRMLKDYDREKLTVRPEPMMKNMGPSYEV